MAGGTVGMVVATATAGETVGMVVSTATSGKTVGTAEQRRQRRHAAPL